MRRSSLSAAIGGGAWLAFASIAFAPVSADPASQPDRLDTESSSALNAGVPPPPGMGDDVCLDGSGNSCTIDADCPGAACGNKSAYISFTPPAGADLAIQITIAAMPRFPDRVGDVWWVKAPRSVADAPDPPITVAEVECTTAPHRQDWGTVGLFHVFGESILPSPRAAGAGISVYEVRMCTDIVGPCSTPLPISTETSADVVAPFGGGGQPNAGDINAIVRKFQQLIGSPSIARADFVGTNANQAPTQTVNFVDIFSWVKSFQGSESQRPEPRQCAP